MKIMNSQVDYREMAILVSGDWLDWNQQKVEVRRNVI
jgi:hypothetical protein